MSQRAAPPRCVVSPASPAFARAAANDPLGLGPLAPSNSGREGSLDCCGSANKRVEPPDLHVVAPREPARYLGAPAEALETEGVFRVRGLGYAVGSGRLWLLPIGGPGVLLIHQRLPRLRAASSLCRERAGLAFAASVPDSRTTFYAPPPSTAGPRLRRKRIRPWAFEQDRPANIRSGGRLTTGGHFLQCPLAQDELHHLSGSGRG